MVPQRGENRSSQVLLEHLVHAGLGVLGISPRRLSLPIMRHEIPRIDSPRERVLTLPLPRPRSRQRTNSLKSSQRKIIRSITQKRPIRGSRQQDIIIETPSHGTGIKRIRPTAHPRRAVGLRIHRIPRIQMEVGQMQHLDAVPARLGNARIRIRRLGLGEERGRVQRGRVGLAAKRLTQGPANVFAVETLQVRIGEHLRPHGAEGRGGKLLLAGAVGCESEVLAQRDHRIRDGRGGEQRGILGCCQCVLALGTSTTTRFVGFVVNDVDDFRRGRLDDHTLLAVG